MKSNVSYFMLENNGAYDSGCVYNHNGALSFYSYKDLQTLKTYQIFEYAIHMLVNGDFTFFYFISGRISYCRLKYLFIKMKL